ncbi:hypothetical protein BJY52DRAFT_1214415 [Lactarius psammicola]|nr:hypothetical protein BJY52DRAFT_1214415 [Lactarius psammicola]
MADIMFALSSRLHVQLVFTPNRPPRPDIMRRLPPLPIFIDHSAGSWSTQEFKFAVEALIPSDRVPAVASRGTRTGIETVLLAMSATSRHFCKLEFPDLRPTENPVLRIPKIFTVGSRFLFAISQNAGYQPPVLDLYILICDAPQISLFLTQLQQMPSTGYESHPLSGEGTVPPIRVIALPGLTSFLFCGLVAHLEGIVNPLAAHPAPLQICARHSKAFSYISSGFRYSAPQLYPFDAFPFHGFLRNPTLADVTWVTRMVDALSNTAAIVDELIL